MPEWRKWTVRLSSRILEAERKNTLTRPIIDIIETYAAMDVIKETPIAVNREQNDALGYLPPIPTLSQKNANGYIHHLRDWLMELIKEYNNKMSICVSWLNSGKGDTKKTNTEETEVDKVTVAATVATVKDTDDKLVLIGLVGLVGLVAFNWFRWFSWF